MIPELKDLGFEVTVDTEKDFIFGGGGVRTVNPIDKQEDISMEGAK